MDCVLIIGNGFDLHCGLASSYSDFFDYELSNNEYYKKAKLSYQDYGDPLPDGLNSFCDAFTAWDYLFLFGGRFFKDEKFKNWFDVENAISTSLKREDSDFSGFSWLRVYNLLCGALYNGSSDPSDYTGVEKLEALSLDGFISLFDSTGAKRTSLSKERFYSCLLDQLKKYESRFSDYIGRISSSDTYLEKSLVTFSELLADFFGTADSGRCYVMSFNYTNPSLVSGEISFPEPLELRHRHGCCRDRDIVFGISQNDLQKFDPIYRFTKSDRRSFLLKDHAIDVRKPDLNGLACRVVIYGHSLNNQDMDFFFELFDDLDLGRRDLAGKTSMVYFAYSVFGGKTLESCLDEEFAKARELFLLYGNKRGKQYNVFEQLLDKDAIRFMKI